MTSGTNSQRTVRGDVLIVALAMAGAGILAATHWAYTTDDTYIYVQFAKNMIAGHGMAFNIGEQTYGFTSPLWLFLIASVGVFGVAPVLAAKVLGVVFTLAEVGIMYPLARRILEKRETAMAVTIVWMTNAWALRWGMSGVETPCAVFITMAAMLVYMIEKDRGVFRFAGLLFGVAAVTRPELSLLFVLAVIDHLISKPAHPLYGILRLSIPAGIIVIPWCVAAINIFHTLIPNTALAKAGFSLAPSEIKFTAVRIGEIIGATNAVEGFFALVLLGYWIRKRFNPSSLLLILWVVALPLLYIGTDAGVLSRYMLMMIPMLMLLGWRGFELMAASRKRFRIALAVLTCAVVLQNQVILWRVVQPHTRVFTQDIERTLIPMGQWLNANTPPHAVIAAGDIGAVAYYSDRKILDLGGLVTPPMHALYHGDNTLDSVILHRLYLRVGHPDYLIDSHTTDSNRLSRPYPSPPLFTPLRVWSVAGLGIVTLPYKTYYTVYKLTY